jgi:hypothetical protein
MNQILVPVFVRLKDCGDVVRYDSVAKMQSDFERIDVENAEYEARDAMGARLNLSVQESDDWLLIEPAPNPQPEGLSKAIMEFARVQGIEIDDSSLRKGDFCGALDHVVSATHAKKRSTSWWQKLKRRFS